MGGGRHWNQFSTTIANRPRDGLPGNATAHYSGRIPSASPAMPTSKSSRDARVDAYIAAAAPFARPLLEHIRAAMHAACPDLVEDIKWNHPFFLLDGKPFANMAAFKAHCTLGFWRGGRAVAEPGDAKEKAMGQFGRLQTLADLPAAAALRRRVVEARDAWLAARETKAAAPRTAREKPALPDDFAAALRTQRAAQKAFDGFTPGQQNEYVDWVLEARREATRASRIAQAVEWIAEGKTRNWKYQAC